MIKEKNYSIRLSNKMTDFLTEEAKKRELLPSEYLRYLIQKEMENLGYGKTDK